MTPNEHGSSVIDTKDGMIAFGMAVSSLLLYMRTLVPGLLPGDSGEFQTLAYSVDHAHTTGYEVYILLAKLFTLIVPVNDIAYRVNLLSAVCAALTVALVYLAGRVLSYSRWSGAAAAFALAISATFWSQSIIAEVYTAGSAVTSAVLLLVLLWFQTGRGKFLFAAGLLGGLGMGIHGSNSLFAVAVVALIVFGRPGQRFFDLRTTWKPALAGAALGLALALVAFTMVDLRNTQANIFNSVYRPSASRWDVQPETLDSITGRFSFLVFARQWRSAMFANPEEVMPANQKQFDRTFQQDFALPIRLLALLGFLSLFIRQWKLGIFFTLALAMHGLYTLNYQIGDLYVFFISFYVYFCSLIAEGLAVLLRFIERIPGGLPKLLIPALAALALIMAAAPFYPQRVEALKNGELRFDFMNLPSNTELRYWHQRTAYNVKDLPPNAVVLMDWANLYQYFYVAQVEQNRPNLLFIETYPYAVKNGIAETLVDYVGGCLEEGHPVYSLAQVDELQQAGYWSSAKTVGIVDMFMIQRR